MKLDPNLKAILGTIFTVIVILVAFMAWVVAGTAPSC